MKLSKLCILAATLTLGACGTGKALSDAVVPDIHHKETEWKQVKFENLPGYITVSQTGKTYNNGDTLDISRQRQNALNMTGYEGGIIINGQKIKLESGELHFYKRAESVVVGRHITKIYDKDTQAGQDTRQFHVFEIQGRDTAFNSLPASGTSTYTGTAFNGVERDGKLSYTIDFARKTGQGKISGLSDSYNFNLERADIYRSPKGGSAIDGTATQNGVAKGHYELSIFGKKAEEIAGKVQSNDSSKNDVGFSGKR